MTGHVAYRRAGTGDPQSRIEAARQHIVSRNWRFSLLPRMTLVLLVIVLCWEILRLNIGSKQFPWCLQLLGVAPAATLSGVFAGLILAREQFARSLRPNLSWSTNLISHPILGDNTWCIRLMNAGPGLAHIASIGYSIDLVGQPARCDHSRYQEARELLANNGLRHGSDYCLELLTSGAPLPAVSTPAEGIEFAAFTLHSLERFDQLDFHVTVMDIVGDIHGKSLPFLATLVGCNDPGHESGK